MSEQIFSVVVALNELTGDIGCHQVQVPIRGQEYRIELTAGKKQIVVNAESCLEGVLWRGAFSAKSEDLPPPP